MLYVHKPKPPADTSQSYPDGQRYESPNILTNLQVFADLPEPGKEAIHPVKPREFVFVFLCLCLFLPGPKEEKPDWMYATRCRRDPSEGNEFSEEAKKQKIWPEECPHAAVLLLLGTDRMTA